VSDTSASTSQDASSRCMKKALSLGTLLLLGAFFISPQNASASTIYASTTSTGQHTTNSILPTGNGTVKHARVYVPAFTTDPVVWISSLGSGVFSSSAGTYPPATFVASDACVAVYNGVDRYYECNFATGQQYAITNYTAGGAPSDYLYFKLCGGTATTSSCTGIVAYDDNVGIALNGTSYGWKGSIDDLVFSAGLLWDSEEPLNLIFSASSTVDINDSFNAGGLATTSLRSFCDTNLPYDDSDIIQATITYVPNALCRLTTYLVLPTTDSINQFADLRADTMERFPFSYVNSVYGTWTALTASSTANSPSFTYSLHDLTLGSTTPIGNILPNIEVFSSTTVQEYFPASTFAVMKALAGIAILLTLIADIFFTTKKMMK